METKIYTIFIDGVSLLNRDKPLSQTEIKDICRLYDVKFKSTVLCGIYCFYHFAGDSVSYKLPKS